MKGGLRHLSFYKFNNIPQQIKAFENKWVALVDDAAVASGDSLAEVIGNAEKTAISYTLYTTHSEPNTDRMAGGPFET
jgi:hypothetical protein